MGFVIKNIEVDLTLPPMIAEILICVAKQNMMNGKKLKCKQIILDGSADVEDNFEVIKPYL